MMKQIDYDDRDRASVKLTTEYSSQLTLELHDTPNPTFQEATQSVCSPQL